MNRTRVLAVATLCLLPAISSTAQTPAKQDWHTLPAGTGAALAWTINAPRGNSGELMLLARATTPSGTRLSRLTTLKVDCQAKSFRALSQVAYGADFKETGRTPPGPPAPDMPFGSVNLPVVAQMPTEEYAVALAAQFQCGVTQPDALRQMVMTGKGMQTDVDGAQRWLDGIAAPQVAAAPAPTRADARTMLVGAWESTITAGGMIPLNQKIDVKMGSGGVLEAVRTTKTRTLKFTLFDVIDGEIHAQINEGGNSQMTTYCKGKLNSSGTQITGSCYAETYQDGKATLYDSDQPWKATKVGTAAAPAPKQAATILTLEQEKALTGEARANMLRQHEELNFCSTVIMALDTLPDAKRLSFRLHHTSDERLKNLIFDMQRGASQGRGRDYALIARAAVMKGRMDPFSLTPEETATDNKLRQQYDAQSKTLFPGGKADLSEDKLDGLGRVVSKCLDVVEAQIGPIEQIVGHGK